MLNNFFDKFSLHPEKEDLENVIKNVENGLVFRGTNLWVLIFAIFVASLGLNVNSPAVIIGAMLISPLMGPIMGIGVGIGINDASMLRKAFYNYFVATIVALTTSTLFFLLSPLNEAHSEILARTSPNIYDVLIALFGGLAGIVATTSKLKGNVIPGVAIATALMPPLCTAGYGLATLKPVFFLGAFYLFIINTVFIALSSFIVVRILHFPYRHLKDPKAERVAHRIILVIAIITLLPSIYFGYDMIQQNKFVANANRFITSEGHFNNDYLLSRKVDAKERKILLVFGGDEITQEQIIDLKTKVLKYSIDSSRLEIRQGFAYLGASNNDMTEKSNEQLEQLSHLLNEKQEQIKQYQHRWDSIARFDSVSKQVIRDIKSLNFGISKVLIQPAIMSTDSVSIGQGFFIILSSTKRLSRIEKIKLEEWIRGRMNTQNIKLSIE